MSTRIAPANHVRFNVADVTPSTERLPSEDLKAALCRATETRVLICPNADREVIRDADFHPLIAAAAFAFKQHFPLALSPDMIWLTILQGIAQHMQNNPERLRNSLVQHQTKIELVVDPNLFSLPQNDPQMLAVANLFAEQIARHLHPARPSLFNAEFSTTSDADRIAASVVMMDAFQPYFDYVLCVICGIPGINQPRKGKGCE